MSSKKHSGKPSRSTNRRNTRAGAENRYQTTSMGGDQNEHPDGDCHAHPPVITTASTDSATMQNRDVHHVGGDNTKTAVKHTDKNNNPQSLGKIANLSITECTVERDNKLFDGGSDNHQTGGQKQDSSFAKNKRSEEYHLKWIKWNDGNPTTCENKVPIVTQNSNGACPLIGLINVMLLRKRITIPSGVQIVTGSQLMNYLYEAIQSYMPTNKNLSVTFRLNFEKNLQDCMTILPRLQTGLDVNIKFTGVQDFEYTPECIIFDILSISLYHGWLVDPAFKELDAIINNLSYNQLVDKIISAKASPNGDNQMFIAEDFLKQTASQLTKYGLSQLIKCIKEGQLSILFRNNHFTTLYKHKGNLYQLVTDQGFLTEPNVVWESLDNIEGNTQFVDCDFVPIKMPKWPLSMPTMVPSFANSQLQIDHDYLLALSLAREEKIEMESHAKNSERPMLAEADDKKMVDIIMNDEEFARKLQAEEDQLYEQSRRLQNNSDEPGNRSFKTNIITGSEYEEVKSDSNERLNESSNDNNETTRDRHSLSASTGSRDTTNRNKSGSSSNIEEQRHSSTSDCCGDTVVSETAATAATIHRENESRRASKSQCKIS